MSSISTSLKLYIQRMILSRYPSAVIRRLSGFTKVDNGENHTPVRRAISYGALASSHTRHTLVRLGISYAATVAFLYLHAHPLVPVVTSSPWFVLASATKGPPEKDEDKAKDEDEVVDRVIDLSKENPTGKRVADYFRVSTTKQREGLSRKAQEEELM